MGLVNIQNAEPQELIRVFPYRTSFTPDDSLAFVGQPPLFRPLDRNIPVHVSVTFTWHRAEAERVAASWRDHYDNVRIGGPAYEDYGDEFTPGRYLKLGCTIGLFRSGHQQIRVLYNPTWMYRKFPQQPQCFVHPRLVACSEKHIHAVFSMLRAQKRAIRFPGGLDKHFLKPWHRPLFDSISIDELWFACDVTSDLPWLEKAAEILEGIPLRKRRCYTMIGYDEEPLSQAERRIERVFELGFMPFCQLYRPDEGPKEYPPEWKAVQRKWSRPAAYMGKVADGDSAMQPAPQSGSEEKRGHNG